MNVTIQPAVVNAMAHTARDVGGTTIAKAPRKLADAQGDAGGARIGGLGSSALLDGCLATWVDVGTGIRDKTVSTGDKLAATVHTYLTSDHTSGDQFRATRVPGSVRPV